MTTFADLKHQFDLLNGYEETGGPSGHDGNVTKLWAELQPSLQGAPWCAACDCYCWKHAGHPFPAIDHAWGFSYCPDAVVWAKKNGLWSASGHYEPGDTTFWDFTGHGVAEHTGTVVEDRGGAGVYEFEGNTMPSLGGNQANGGGAYYKIRPHGSQLLGVLKSSRWLTDHPQHTAPPKPKPRKVNPFHYDAHFLPLHEGVRDHGKDFDVHWAQWALSIPVDGVFGPQTEHAVRVYQQHRGLHVDGVIGPQTASALMHVTH